MRNSSLKRLSGYGAAAAAVLGSTTSFADVTFVDVNPAATGSSPNNAVLLSFSLTGVVATDGSHVANEQFYATHTYSNAKLGSSSKLRFNGNGTTTLDGHPLTYGTTIGPGQTVNPTNTISTLTGFQVVPGPGDISKGYWSSSQEAYLALKFDNSGTPNYGWADITVNSAASITLHGFAYDNTGGPIAAGDINTIPEPTQIALFAIGASGVAVYRRRKERAGASR